MDNDDYGNSKRIAAEWIKEEAKNTKIIKTSIFGPELNTKVSLMEWFLSQEGEVFGYTKAIWNGNTTLEWSKRCLQLMNDWHIASNETIISSAPISKFNLLHAIKDEFNKDIDIKEKELGSNKCLNGILYTGTIQEQLKELREFYY